MAERNMAITEKIQSFHDLRVWQEAHKFVLKIYAITKNFPMEEKFGLTNQLRRAAVSVASNIVEGFKRRSKNDSLHFYTMSEASLDECRYQLLLSRDLNYLAKEQFNDMENHAVIIAKMLFKFKQTQK